MDFNPGPSRNSTYVCVCVCVYKSARSSHDCGFSFIDKRHPGVDSKPLLGVSGAHIFASVSVNIASWQMIIYGTDKTDY